ncbi:MAG: hypothetical protein KBA61_05255 [Spirochaetes bacterium]|nr:hypothetical protein [Spirochaetota bacterium]
MELFRKTVLPILAATAWIGASEFFRNEVLLKSHWVDHYRGLGLVFPSEPVNGAVWGLWSLFLAIGIFIISKKFSLIQTTILSWFMAFVMMWVVIGNMGVLPGGLLYFAVPLSLLEAFVASFIIARLGK